MLRPVLEKSVRRHSQCEYFLSTYVIMLASLVFALVTIMTLRVFAPVLSAQTITAFRGMERVMYVLNSSTPFAETALDFVDIF